MALSALLFVVLGVVGHVAGGCYETDTCQPNTWNAVGCGQKCLFEKSKRPCKDGSGKKGFFYTCCSEPQKSSDRDIVPYAPVDRKNCWVTNDCQLYSWGGKFSCSNSNSNGVSWVEMGRRECDVGKGGKGQCILCCKSKSSSNPTQNNQKPNRKTQKPAQTGSGGKSSGPRRDGVTTRYWDCCKPSCSWPGKASVTAPVKTCGIDGVTKVDPNQQSGCNGGSAYVCNNQQPFVGANDISYGFAAASIDGLGESNWCCACYELTFTSGPVQGKKMIVQVTNTGGDLNGQKNHFDLQIPGGGVGLFNGCKSQWHTGEDGWGQRYGGVSSRSECAQLPKQLQAGCYWRFDWFKNADNPKMSFVEVKCPAELTSKTGCTRK